MADNVYSQSVSSQGQQWAVAVGSFSGDTVGVAGTFQIIASGSEGAWTFSPVVGGAGAVAAGVQRVTLASDDPVTTAVQLLDDAVGTHDSAKVDKGISVGGWAATTRLNVEENDFVTAWLYQNGAQVVSLATEAGAKLGGDATNGLDVDVTRIIPGTSATHLGKAEDAAHNTGDTGVFMLAVRSDTAAATGQTDGDYTALVTDSSGRLHVACTNAGTFVVQENGAALTALQLIDDTVYTDDAAFTPGTSKVLAIGAQADEDTTDSVDEGDVGALRMTLERKLRTVAALDSAAMQSGNDQVTPKFAVISASTSGDNTIVAAVASKKIRVLSLFFTANGTVTTRFESGASGTALTGQSDFVVNTGMVLPFNPVGWFETAAATLLNLELSGAVEVAGGLTYIEVD